jgi:(p)ppGpp synthase/HD superfamily hydrolase
MAGASSKNKTSPGLARAITIAAQAHEEQVDKNGAPYILHPIRVMLKMGTEEAMTAAVLHDVVEDSDWTLEKLRAQGFSERVLAAVEAVTKRAEEDSDYDAFILRVMKNPLARRIKIADLEDNMDPKRILRYTAKDATRLEKYHRAWKTLHGS